MRIVFVIAFASCLIFNATAQPKELWTFQSKGKIYSSPATDGNLLFIGSADQHVYALDRKTGKEIWRFKTGGAVHSSPAVAGKFVLFTSHDGFVYALKSKNGELAWKYQTNGEAVYDLWDYYLSSPVVRDGVVYVGSGDHHVYALNEMTGKLIWKFRTDGVVHATPVVSDSLLYIGSFDGNFYAIERGTGKLAWKFDTVGETYFPKGEVQKEALLHNGVLYFGSRDFYVYALDARTGSLKWNVKEDGSWVIAAPLALEDNLYFGTSDTESFYCMDANSGAKKWKRGLNMRVFGSAVAYSDLVIFGCFNGKLYGVDPKTGSARWEFQTRGSNANYLNVYDESGAFRSDFEKYGKDIEGSEQKLLSLGSILSTPLVDGNSVYFGSADGNVYAVEVQ